MDQAATDEDAGRKGGVMHLGDQTDLRHVYLQNDLLQDHLQMQCRRALPMVIIATEGRVVRVPANR
jgi:hypothetical protein